MPRSDYKPGQEVRLIRPYKFDGRLIEHQGIEIGSVGVVSERYYMYASCHDSIVVEWPNGDRDGNFVDLDCIGPNGPTEEELAEVYKILGVNRTEEV